MKKAKAPDLREIGKVMVESIMKPAMDLALLQVKYEDATRRIESLKNSRQDLIDCVNMVRTYCRTHYQDNDELRSMSKRADEIWKRTI